LLATGSGGKDATIKMWDTRALLEGGNTTITTTPP
jgi:hypothetical protein